MNTENQLWAFAKTKGGYFTRSRRNVPYAVIPFKGKRASVCFFGKGQFFRLFSDYKPFGTTTQNRFDFRTLEDLNRFLNLNG